MLSRKNQEKSLTSFGVDWKKDLEDLLHQNYSRYSLKIGKEFYIYGGTYPNEVLVAISLVSAQRPEEIPITYLVSADLEQNTPSEKLMNTLINSIGLFFDSVFATSNWSDYQSFWQEGEIEGVKFYYQVGRMNLELLLQAEKILEEGESKKPE